MTIATEPEMLTALEDWARGRGWLRQPNDAVKAKWHGQGPWCVETFAFQADAHPDLRGPFVQVWAEAQRDAPLFRVSPAIALAWAILVESEPPPVDVGPCPDCKGAKGREVKGLTAFVAQMVDGGWATPQRPDGSRDGWMPCSACDKTGRRIASVPRLLLDATTDTTALALLHVHADMLCAANDPAGLQLAWGLRWSAGDGELDGTGEATMLVRWFAVARQQDSALTRPDA